MTDTDSQTSDAAGKPPAEPSTASSARDTIESILIALILAFLFRAYVVEAFVIPTGSMAPTLLGAHLAMACPQCGNDFPVDVPDSFRTDSRGRLNAVVLERQRVDCPMCHFPTVIPAGSYLDNGDRILVQKYLYQITEPARWDVVVFKSPENPTVNYIKRLVGLPNERLLIVDGNIYTRPTGAEKWSIARKTDRPEVQRDIWQPVYDSRYVPLDGGDPTVSVQRGQYWAVPWSADNPGDWLIDGRRQYRHTAADLGAIHFDFKQAVSRSVGMYPYNHLKQTLVDVPELLSEDVRVAAGFQPDEQGLEITLSTTGMLDSSDSTQQRLMARISSTGDVTIATQRLTADGEPVVRVKEKIAPLPAAIATEVELWYCDQEASVWVDHVKVATWAFDLPLDVIQRRPPPRSFPQIGIAVRGTPVTLHRVRVDRDIIYTNRTSQNQIARGTYARHYPDGFGQFSGSSLPVTLQEDEFFCLGDNSPMSQDSRYWTTINPWVVLRMLEGDEDYGVVPRELMMGRAFFVYFPALLRRDQTDYFGVPNFGDMRFIH